MQAIEERSVRWFSAQNVIAEPAPVELERAHAEPDFATLASDYSSLLYRVALSVLRNPVEAEDVVQDTFVRVMQHQGKLSAIADLRPWLVRIAWNLSLDRRRRVRPEQLDLSFAATLVARTVPADKLLDEARRMAQVLSSIERLRTAEREVLLLSAMEELTTAEIGAILRRSESSVRSLLFRARTHLRERLEKGEKK
jgi:RNA polymerase sigma-70 factor, ECF subfamily